MSSELFALGGGQFELINRDDRFADAFGAASEDGHDSIGGLRIAPGDLLHGDQHGIVQIPFEIADEIPKTAARIREREQRIVRFCHSPEFNIAGLREIASGGPCATNTPCRNTAQKG